jgi:proline dehydrogenase
MLLKNIMLSLANNQTVTKFIARKGMSMGFARRFVAGETLEEALKAATELNRKGIKATLDHLGENVADAKEAKEAADYYFQVLDVIHDKGIHATISIKLTQLGLDIRESTCKDYVEQIITRAESHDNVVEIDMEDSNYTERTINIFKELRRKHDNLRLCIQAYLYRSEKDIRALGELRSKVRLCKGAYKEPEQVAFQSKKEVDDNYRKLTELLMSYRSYPAIATHDENMITHAKACAERLGLGKSDFEFQMLYGVRRDLQENLKNEGYNMRVYIPYGKEWCPYFMRRLAERPANTWFVIKNLLRD